MRPKRISRALRGANGVNFAAVIPKNAVKTGFFFQGNTASFSAVQKTAVNPKKILRSHIQKRSDFFRFAFLEKHNARFVAAAGGAAAAFELQSVIVKHSRYFKTEEKESQEIKRQKKIRINPDFGERRIRTFEGVSQQIYSLAPLATREPPRFSSHLSDSN